MGAIEEYLKAYNANVGSKSVATPSEPSVETMSPTDFAYSTMVKGQADIQKGGEVISVGDTLKMYNDALNKGLEYQKNKAQEAEKRTHLTTEETGKFGTSRDAWDMLDQIDEAWKDAQQASGALQGPFGGYLNWIIGGFTPQIQAYNTLIHVARPILNAGIMHEAKQQAGETSNVQGFEANLPTITDTPASAESKLNKLRHIVAKATNTLMDSQAAAGRDMSPIYPLIAPIRSWDQAQQHPDQVGTPSSSGPVLNGISPDARALLSKSFQPASPAQAAPPQSQAPTTNPANQPTPAPTGWYQDIFGLYR